MAASVPQRPPRTRHRHFRGARRSYYAPPRVTSLVLASAYFIAIHVVISGTTLRDRFYGVIQAAVLESARSGGPLAGSNFWAWGGAGRAQHEDRRMRAEDTSYVGDPPHEPQGWYSVFDADGSTIALLSAHARALASAA